MDKDPYKGANFSVELDRVHRAGFRECSTISIKIAPIEYQEGGDRVARQLPGKITYTPITLKWGNTDTDELYQWHHNAVLGLVERKSGSIVQLDDSKKEVMRWNFYNAWPSEFTAPTYSGSSTDVAIETLTIICERVERG